MTIIYIAGDGRSGSTLLELILNNSVETISIGEGYRFWKRFYNRDTLCGCGEKIDICKVWNEIHTILSSEIEGYDPKDIWKRIQYLQQFKNISSVGGLINEPEWQQFFQVVKLFYKSLSRITKKEFIIDGSKSIGWLNILVSVNFCEIKILHLERNLQSVANSWKKDIELPEYFDKKVKMPKKNNYVILKNWIKIKYLCRRFSGRSIYKYLKYESLLNNPDQQIENISNFIELKLSGPFSIKSSHSIGGNPIRSTISDEIVIYKKEEALTNLNWMEFFLFSIINRLSNQIL